MSIHNVKNQSSYFTKTFNLTLLGVKNEYNEYQGKRSITRVWCSCSSCYPARTVEEALEGAKKIGGNFGL